MPARRLGDNRFQDSKLPLYPLWEKVLNTHIRDKVWVSSHSMHESTRSCTVPKTRWLTHTLSLSVYALQNQLVQNNDCLRRSRPYHDDKQYISCFHLLCIFSSIFMVKKLDCKYKFGAIAQKRITIAVTRSATLESCGCLGRKNSI